MAYIMLVCACDWVMVIVRLFAGACVINGEQLCGCSG